MRTNVYFIMDCSGSMSGKEADVIGGFNAYIDELRKGEAQDYSITAVKFDTVVETIFKGLPLSEVPTLTSDHYFTRGMTALLDAVGKTVSGIRNGRVTHCTECGQHLEEHSHKDKNVVIITTDGQENSSREWTTQKISDLIRRKEKQGNWTFVYFGANQDSWAQAGNYGFMARNVSNYDTSQTQILYTTAGRTTSRMASGQSLSSQTFGETVSMGTETAAAGGFMSDEDIDKFLTSGGDPVSATTNEVPVKIKRKREKKQ